MAEDESGQEKSEQPTSKRRQEAEEQGNVARSKEFSSMLVLLFTAVSFLMFGGRLSGHIASMMRTAFEFDTDVLRTTAIPFERMYFLMKYAMNALIPILLVILVLSIAAPLLIGGWVFSIKSLSIKMSRLSPLKGFKKMVSLHSLMELVKSLLKFILVAAVSIVVLKIEIPLMLALGNSPLEAAVIQGSYILIKSFALISASLIFIAAIDVPYQIYEHHQSLKMTKQEVKDEHKQTEGSPEAKGAIRRAQMEMARRRMMAEVPKADVILTNPTHYAVAISYKKQGKRAPVVVAKGKNLIAFQISTTAQKHDIPILCIPALTRAIYFSTKLNREIPRGLYVAVAQVLAYIFQLNDKRRYDYKPDLLQNVPIPTELQRDTEEELSE